MLHRCQNQETTLVCCQAQRKGPGSRNWESTTKATATDPPGLFSLFNGKNRDKEL